ncbi:extracellular solute-binding protein [Eubacteriales bacterium OttesenSCG-928-A19]|nr:extracellular solute-binding protein [Eubacteriales bacterium OttesenSCG-928-A19]
MKKWFSLLLVLSLMAACVPALAQDDVITLRLWGGIQPEYGYDTLAENFNEEFKDQGIELEYVRYVNDADGNLQLETYLMAGGEIDIFMGYGGLSRLTNRVEGGLVMDMTDALAARGFDPAEELGLANVSGYRLDDRYYGVPTKYENGMYMFVNADMFEEAGIDIPYDGWTYSEFRDAAKKLTHGEGLDKVYGIYWSYNTNYDYNRLFLTTTLDEYGIYKNDECTETNFDQPVIAESLQLIVDTMLEDESAPSRAYEVSENLSLPSVYLEGKAAMVLGISQMRIVKDLDTYPHDFATAIVPMPVPDESYMEEYGDHKNIGGAGDLICVSSKTDYPEECVDFVIWYIQGGMAPLARGGRIPLWNGVDQAEIVAAMLDGAEGTFVEESIINYLNIDKTKLQPSASRANWALSEIYTVMYEEMEAAMYGQYDVETAVTNMKTRGDALIEAAIKAAE